MRSNKGLIIAGAIAIMVSASAQAAPVAYEDFDYTGGASLTTETNNNGTGWAADWKAATGIAASHTTSGTGTSLQFDQSPALVVGNGTHVWTESEKGNQRDYSAAIDLATESLYLTALVRAYAGSSTGGASEADLRFGLFDGAGATGNMRANVGISDGTLFAAASADGYLAGDTNANAFADDTTYLLVMKRDGSGIYASLIEADGLYSTLESEPVSWQVTDTGATGVDLRSLRMLTDGDGDGGLRVDELRIATSWTDAISSLVVQPSTNELIAADGFRTTGDTGDYLNAGALGTQGSVTPTGTTGFGSTNGAATSWVGTSGNIQAFSNSVMSLTHSGLTGTAQDGAVGIRSFSSQDRNSARSLVAAPPESSSYYLSGLVQANSAAGGLNATRAPYQDDQQRCMGFVDAIASGIFEIGDGFFVGINAADSAVNLAVFANGTAYNLFDISGNYDETFQIVAKLDVGASGNETLTAWVAADGAAELTLALDAQDVGDIWQDIGDLDTFAVLNNASAALSDYEPLDEMRFGISLSAVTALPEPIAGLIATEGFAIAPDGYVDAGILGSAGDMTPTGTTGFGTVGVDASSWGGATGEIKTDDAYSLTHSALTGTAQSGGAGPRSALSRLRNSSRALVGAVPAASSYYLSGLVATASTPGTEGQQRNMGFIDAIASGTYDIGDGFFLGINVTAGGTQNLAVFANHVAYNLFDLSSNLGDTFQIVSRLDVDASGNETLTAWVAVDGATNLTLALDAQDVGDIWQDTGDLDTFAVQTDSNADLSGYQPFDEMRFGTSFSAVTTLPDPTPVDPYETWASDKGLTAGVNDGLTDDAEAGGGDGVNNLLEYALGGDPLVDDAASILPIASLDAGGSWFYYVHNERTGDNSLTYTVQLDNDLVADPTWSTNGVSWVGESADENGFKSVTNRTDVGAAEFLRLEVQKN